MSGVVASKVLPVLTFGQQLPTNTQQHATTGKKVVKTDATCNLNNVGSFWLKLLRPSTLGLMSRLSCFESFLMKSQFAALP